MLTILGVCSPLQLEKVSARKRRRRTRMRDLQSTADDPCGGLGAADRNLRYGHVNPMPFVNAGLGAEPRGALPCGERPSRLGQGEPYLVPKPPAKPSQERLERQESKQELNNKCHGRPLRLLRKHKATVPVASWTLRDCNWDWTGLSAVVNLAAFNSSR